VLDVRRAQRNAALDVVVDDVVDEEVVHAETGMYKVTWQTAKGKVELGMSGKPDPVYAP
jgi:hypothetical protein